jgi:hypothetical protein
MAKIHIKDFIEHLKSLPQNSILRFSSLRDNLEWEDQDNLDVSIEGNEIRFDMYSNKNLNKSLKLI